MLFKICVFFLVPLSVFASFLGDCYMESLVCHFQMGHFDESLSMLDEWEACESDQGNRALGIRASILLAGGDFENGSTLMGRFIQNLSVEERSDPTMNFFLRVYYNIFSEYSIDSACFGGMVHLCKQEQPTGVKLKYWFGVGQILVGILAVPFSAGTSATLIVSGVAMVVDAAADALNNKEAWERELNQRQQLNPETYEAL